MFQEYRDISNKSIFFRRYDTGPIDAENDISIFSIYQVITTCNGI